MSVPTALRASNKFSERRRRYVLVGPRPVHPSKGLLFELDSNKKLEFASQADGVISSRLHADHGLWIFSTTAPCLPKESWDQSSDRDRSQNGDDHVMQLLVEFITRAKKPVILDGRGAPTSCKNSRKRCRSPSPPRYMRS